MRMRCQNPVKLKKRREISNVGWSQELTWLALPVGNEGINLYIGILGMKFPSFPTKGQLVTRF